MRREQGRNAVKRIDARMRLRTVSGRPSCMLSGICEVLYYVKKWQVLRGGRQAQGVNRDCKEG